MINSVTCLIFTLGGTIVGLSFGLATLIHFQNKHIKENNKLLKVISNGQYK